MLKRSRLEADPGTTVAASVQEPPRRHLNSGSEFFHRRDLGVALAVLDPADLPGLHTAARGDLFLGQIESFAGLPKVLAEVAHAMIVQPLETDHHVKLYK